MTAAFLSERPTKRGGDAALNHYFYRRNNKISTLPSTAMGNHLFTQAILHPTDHGNLFARGLPDSEFQRLLSDYARDVAKITEIRRERTISAARYKEIVKRI